MLESSWGGVDRCASSACNWAYSAAVKGFPSRGDRASVIISVLNTSSGISSGGGKLTAGLAKRQDSPAIRLSKVMGNGEWLIGQGLGVSK